MKIQAVRGTKDILPQDLAIWRFIEEKTRGMCEVYGYQEIRTPLLEEASLFARSIGKSSDIVRKEMYSFLDRKKRVLCLRPEATAAVVRAYLEHSLDKSTSLAKFYYFGPMFRAERPQAARLRQFHHIGVEAIGSSDPYLDAEVIALAVNMLKEIGVKHFSVQLNSIGCPKDRKKYKSILSRAVKSKLSFLCADCRNRYKVNLLRIFDCKNETCRKTIRRLPSIGEFALSCSQCAEHFSEVEFALKALSLGVSFIRNPCLVRGLDYYTKTCFEIVHPHLGAQSALGAGGRYDNLVSDLGGRPTPAVGFALGVERIIAALGQLEPWPARCVSVSVYIATVGKEPKEQAFKQLLNLRKQGIFCEMNFQDKSLKGQMRLANKRGFKYVAILGEEELKKQTIILRDMQNKSQEEIEIDDLAERLK